MTECQHAWAVVWDHAAATSGPFEIADVVPAVAVKAGLDEDQARRTIELIVGEAHRLPEGQQFFCVEGSAIVPQGEFFDAILRGVSAADAYPFEL